MARNTFPQIPKELQGRYAVSNMSHVDRIAAFKAYFTEVGDFSLNHSKSKMQRVFKSKRLQFATSYRHDLDNLARFGAWNYMDNPYSE